MSASVLGQMYSVQNLLCHKKLYSLPTRFWTLYYYDTSNQTLNHLSFQVENNTITGWWLNADVPRK